MTHKVCKVTIITAVYNGELHLENAIQSVLYQDYDDIEYIVIDGGSTDRTIDSIKKYEDKIAYWVSEKDNGIGDAWNKGIKKATGHLIGLLNVDDMYHKTTVSNAVKAYLLYGDNSLLYGTCKFITNEAIVGINAQKFNPDNLMRGFGFTHTACFVPQKVYDKVGLFDTTVKIAVDTEFLLRCYQNKVSFEKINSITYMRLGGVSDRKAKQAYFEYLDKLQLVGEAEPKTIVRQKFIYNLYHPFRNVLKSIWVRNQLRQVKHILVFLLNKIYSFLPTFTIKNFYLKLLGIQIGDKSYIHPKTIIYRQANLSIGNNTVINPNSILDNRNGIVIGNSVSIAHGCKIYTAGHDISSPYCDITGEGVIIEDYALIFSNVSIMPGVVMGKGAVAYSGSVIVKSVPPYTVVGGNPAKKIKNRDNILLYKDDYGFSGIIA
jgi:acetyltransferase-like isoleucine patch superfamily enzyme